MEREILTLCSPGDNTKRDLQWEVDWWSNYDVQRYSSVQITLSHNVQRLKEPHHWLCEYEVV